MTTSTLVVQAVRNHNQLASYEIDPIGYAKNNENAQRAALWTGWKSLHFLYSAVDYVHAVEVKGR